MVIANYWRGFRNTGHTTTKIVAASNSAPTNRQRADYICDGISDEIEINQALNALPSGGGCVHLLEGTYNTASAITFPSDNIMLCGCGKATHIKSPGGFQVIYAVNRQYLSIQNLYVQGADTVIGAGINLISCDFSSVVNCWLEDNRTGIRILGGEDNTVVGCFCRSNVYYGILLDTGSTPTVADCHSSDNGYYGIYIYNVTGSQVVGNSADTNTYHGVIVNSGSRNILSSNTARHNLRHGIYLYQTSENVVSSNVAHDNDYQDTGTYDGIRLYGSAGTNSNNNVLIGNRCYDNDRVGMSVSNNCNYTLTTGNQLLGNTAGALSEGGNYSTGYGNVEDATGDFTVLGGGPAGSTARVLRIDVNGLLRISGDIHTNATL